MQESKLDTIELLAMPDKSPAFRVTKSSDHTFCIIPDLAILGMPDCKQKHDQLAQWANLTAKYLGLPIKFWVSLDGNSLEWEMEKGPYMQFGGNILN